jgi:acetolactate decarboxylase
VPGAAVTQFATIDALLAGAYESGLRVAEARSIGDFGLGCVDHLGGEVVIVDGEAIECTLDGPPLAMDDDDILPFAIVCRFPEVPRVGLGEQDFAGFAASVEGALTSRNLFHAVRFDGVLSEVCVRVTPCQHHPFPRLAEVTSHQVETVARDIRGTVVGFWTPAIYQGIAVADLHLHFLSEDRSIGGHVLDLAAHSGASTWRPSLASTCTCRQTTCSSARNSPTPRTIASSQSRAVWRYPPRNRPNPNMSEGRRASRPS